MRTLLLFLTIGCGTIFAQSPANSPLTPDDGRQILGQLYDAKACREEIFSYRDYVERDRAQDERAQANVDRALEIEKKATAIEKEKAALAQEKAAMYEQLYRSGTKGPGVGCRILRVITGGIARCN
jgi:hypothetical protein